MCIERSTTGQKRQSDDLHIKFGKSENWKAAPPNPQEGGDTAFKLNATPAYADTTIKQLSTSHFHCRNGGAELHGLSGNFTTASAKRQREIGRAHV